MSTVATLIYEPKGRAREYAALALNIYRGCDHGCTYCYAPQAVHREREAFVQSEPRPHRFIQRLIREAFERPPTEPILLCFTCDPYQVLDVDLKLTREVIQILHSYGHRVNILTKGGTRACRDLDLFTAQDAFATTLTFPRGDSRWQQWEAPSNTGASGLTAPARGATGQTPEGSGSASPEDRYEAIRRFHRAGIPTWVSLEPVLDPEATLQIIRDTHRSVDLFKVGKLNWHGHANTIDWPKFARDAVALLDRLGAKYYLKKDLACFLPVPTEPQPVPTEPQPEASRRFSGSREGAVPRPKGGRP